VRENVFVFVETSHSLRFYFWCVCLCVYGGEESDVTEKERGVCNWIMCVTAFFCEETLFAILFLCVCVCVCMCVHVCIVCVCVCV